MCSHASETVPDIVSDNFFVLTGGPGAGKTSLIHALSAKGYDTHSEAGRAIIKMQTAIGGPARPSQNPLSFAELMLGWDMRSYESARDRKAVQFFDRGIPDTLGYLTLENIPVPGHMQRSATHMRYNRKVFILPPWREIFTRDSERKQDWHEAVRTHDAMVEIYAGYGYDLVTVPQAAIEERVHFVLQHIC